jgi:transmembrane sensor
MNANPDPSDPRTGAEAAAADWVVRRDAGFSPAEARAFQAWLEADPRHRAAWNRFDSAWSVLDRPRRSGGSDRMVRELRAAIRRRRAVAAGVAGAAAVLLCAAFWQLRRPAEKPPAAAPTVLVWQPTEKVLPDGSVVTLKPGAEIAVDFSGHFRRVALRRGEALFRVAKNARRPFVVEAGGLEVRAVGTEFSVDRRPGEVGVLVTEGRVALDQAVAGANGPALAPRTLAFVDAGNRATVRDGAATLETPLVVGTSPREVDQRLAWLGTQLEFSTTPLAEAVALLNQHNRLQFVIGDPALADVRLSGFIRADNAEEFAQFLEAGFQIRTERRGENEIVLRRRP